MIENDAKLIAKIQHFYDHMIRRIEELAPGHFKKENSCTKEHLEDLIEFGLVYAQIFSDFLYIDEH